VAAADAVVVVVVAIDIHDDTPVRAQRVVIKERGSQ
jgi:hypothetical protein